MNRTPYRDEGFTLVEVTVSIAIMLIGLASLAIVFGKISQQNRELRLRRLLVSTTRSLVEEIKGTPAATITGTYDGRTYPVEGVSGTGPGGAVISVAVDSSIPKLLGVTITSGWTLDGVDSSLSLETWVFHVEGTSTAGPMTPLQIRAYFWDLADNNPGPVGDKARDVALKMDTAVTELAKSPPDNPAAIGNMQGAKGDLQAMIDTGLIDPLEGQRLMDEIDAQILLL